MIIMEEMKIISSKLGALHNTVLSLYAELESENMERQALDVIECIGFCVNDIKNYVDGNLKEK